MEKAHLYLKADSMHATIERAAKHQAVYNTREWETILGMAR